jgi:hypothetical protein
MLIEVVECCLLDTPITDFAARTAKARISVCKLFSPAFILV